MKELISSIPLLPWLVLIPLMGTGVILLIPAGEILKIRSTAIGTTFLTLALSVFLFLTYSPGDGFQFQTQINWIPSLGISYHAGLDGIGAAMVLLHGLLSFSGAL